MSDMSDPNRPATSPFDNLMAQMGVKQLGGKSGPRKPAPPMVADSPQRGGSQAPSAHPPVVAPAPPARVVEDPRLALFREEATTLRAEATALRARSEHLEAERAALQQQLEAGLVEREEMDTHRKSLQRALAEAATPGHKPPPDLGTVLTKYGLKPTTEADTLLRAVAEAHVGHELVALLQPFDLHGLHVWLEDRVALVCGGERCPAPAGRAIVVVPPTRCEICGGSDIRRAVRLFVDATLMSGASRVTIVGGSPKYHRTLRELISHRSLSVDLVPGNTRRTKKQAQADLDRSHIVIIWGGSILDHSTSELYEGGGPARVIRVPQRGIARMLERATELLAA